VPDPAAQRRYFDRVADAHFRWQTGDGYFADCERALLHAAALPTGGSLLEIGCGEGGNLANLAGDRDGRGWAGIDFVPAKVAHAQRRLPAGAFAAADAEQLPFPGDHFDAVLIRDVLHHARDRQRVVAEAIRVLRPGGVLAVVEPNRASPLILAQAFFVPAERGVLRSHAARIAAELAALDEVSVTRAQPLPLARLFHPRVGLDAVPSRPWARASLSAVDATLARVVPRWAWMYIVARGKKRTS
jgi:ubiquinone/menaquinone biosynthesis C-methylase UbiE